MGWGAEENEYAKKKKKQQKEEKEALGPPF